MGWLRFGGVQGFVKQRLSCCWVRLLHLTALVQPPPALLNFEASLRGRAMKSGVADRLEN